MGLFIVVLEFELPVLYIHFVFTNFENNDSRYIQIKILYIYDARQKKY